METSHALQVKVEQKIGLLNWNFEELNTQLDGYLEKYKGLQFSDEEMKDAKKIKAELNHLSKAINDRKLDVKKEFCAPYDEFANQAMKLVNKVKEVTNEIDAQVKDYDNRIKEEKRQRIADWWSENGKKNIPIEQIFNERWLNNTYSDKQWQADLVTRNAQITNDLATIASFEDKRKTEFMIVDYMETLSMADSLMAWERREQARKRAEEETARMAAIQQERAKATGQAQTEQDERIPAPAPIAPQAPAETPAGGPEDWLYSPTFQMIDLTYAQAMALTTFMNENHMRFRSIAKDRRKK